MLERGEPIVAPDLILAEVCNAAWKSLRGGELAPPQFDAILNDVAQPFSRLVLLDRLIRPAAALTLELDHPVYDGLCLALAHSEDWQSSPPISACWPRFGGRSGPAEYHGSD